MTSRKGTFGEYVQIDGAQLAEVLRSPNGPVARWMLETAEAVKLEAQRTAPVYQPDPGDPFAGRRKRRPGTGRDSIVKRVAAGSSTDFPITVLVGTDDPIMFLQHQGTAPHPIVARRAPMLVFWSRKQQRVVRVKAVRHPGTRANPFLVEALQTVIGRQR